MQRQGPRDEEVVAETRRTWESRVHGQFDEFERRPYQGADRRWEERVRESLTRGVSVVGKPIGEEKGRKQQSWFIVNDTKKSGTCVRKKKAQCGQHQGKGVLEKERSEK